MAIKTDNLLQASKSHRQDICLAGTMTRYQGTGSWFELPVNSGVPG